ncbi:hypothetical protein O9H85_24290 [Paenibacillus filicis]|uniref:Uncharacterized protein n=1 Tax=Paenibacillus gyeongsangnamensis TaxID=3388067 RepID=A0ABT4QFA1_9BACL|nr:hypothetical protein [Paenibacillus filicis]MCZ8515467.1 hypothetical protein [Paenibacillus filicis]
MLEALDIVRTVMFLLTNEPYVQIDNINGDSVRQTADVAEILISNEALTNGASN